MTAYFVTIFMVGLVLGLGKMFFLIAMPNRLNDKFYVLASSMFWLAMAGWSMYWIVV